MPHTDHKDNQILKLQKENERLKKQLTKFGKDKYGLFWFDVPEGFEDDVENMLPILKEVPKLAIKSRDEKPTHILIEGDNYHALTCLNYTHKGKIDVIYIDPPYNTGNDGFKYKDKRILDKYPDGTEVPVDHPLRHSYWLSFMRKRLELARDILNETGTIFISIDDNELAQLKLLCDEVFGKNNFIDILAVQMSTAQGEKIRAAKNGSIVKNTEFCLIYSKNKNKQIVKNLLFDSTKYDNHYSKFLDEISEGVYKIKNLNDEAIKNNQIKRELESLRLLKNEKLPNDKIAEAFELSKSFRDFIIKNKDKVGRIHDVINIKNKKLVNKKISEKCAVKYQSESRDYLIVKNGEGFYQVITLQDKINMLMTSIKHWEQLQSGEIGGVGFI